MASRNQHLNATLGREVVYCHGCQYEWYRDDRPGTLVCPHCHSDITEIVSLDNDPRTMNDDDSLSDFEHRNHIPFHDSDSDPEEADVEEHIFHGHGGFHGRRAIYRSPDPHGPGNGTRTSPDNREQILRRFQEMLGDMGGGRPTFGRSGPETLFSSPPQVSIRAFSGPGGVGGVSSFTIATGSGRARPGPAGAGMGEDPFQSMLSSLLGNMGPPIDRDAPHPPHPNGGEGEARHPPDFSRALTQLMMTILNPQTIHGDAVYSQEALDRIITNLMEANPQSNAPAPASEEAIAKLSKKKLDEQMLGPELKGECTICIDEMEAGDEAVVLPCKHWFHEQCVVLWLKQHNTCPICRAPIDGEAAGRPGGSVPNSRAESASSPSSFRPGAPDRRRTDQAASSNRRQGYRRDSNSPPTYSGSARSSRVRSPSPGRRSAQSERTREGRGSSGGPLHWIRDQFRGADRRS